MTKFYLYKLQNPFSLFLYFIYYHLSFRKWKFQHAFNIQAAKFSILLPQNFSYTLQYSLSVIKIHQSSISKQYIYILLSISYAWIRILELWAIHSKRKGPLMILSIRKEGRKEGRGPIHKGKVTVKFFFNFLKDTKGKQRIVKLPYTYLIVINETWEKDTWDIKETSILQRTWTQNS